MPSQPVSRVVRDPRFDRLVPPDATLEWLADGTVWAEGPVYVPDEDALVWSDIPNDRVLRWQASDGAVSEVYRPADFANGHTLDHDGTILACEHGSRSVTRYERDGSRTTIVDRYEGKRLNSPNDIIVASDGAIWFTDPPYGIVSDREGHTSESELGACYVFRLDRATGELAIVSDAMVDPNGLAFSPDESVLYVSDTSRARIEGGNHHMLAFDVIDGGTRLGPPRVFAVIEPGLSDGFRVDVEGNVWTSAGDGVHVLTPDGTELGRLLVPEPVGNLTFGGTDGQRLFIVATSTLWSVQVGVRGADHALGRRFGMTQRPLVALTRTAFPGDPAARLTGLADVRIWPGETAPSLPELIELADGATALLAINGDPMGRAWIEASPDLRLVAVASAGYDSLDTGAAFARGIAVTNTPGVLHEATADIAFGLILAARRRIAEADRFVRAGLWHDIRLATMMGHDIHGARLGIVGYGEIGRAVARRGTGFGMDIVHHSRTRVDDAVSRWVPLDELLATSDIVSLHTPLTPETRGLIGERELRLMKPSATLVNTSRGPVVDEAALVRALREGWIASAGIDVQVHEPNPDANDPLLSLPTLVILPHIGSATEGARVGMIGLAADNVLAFLEGRPLLTPVAGSPLP